MNQRLMNAYLLFAFSFIGVITQHLDVTAIQRFTADQASAAEWEEYMPEGGGTAFSIGYPYSRNKTPYHIFINKTKVATINPGERITIQMTSEVAYRVYISESLVYTEPTTPESNSHNISTKLGNDYYFLINRKGRLEYITNHYTGEKAFYKSSDYKRQTPIITGYSETYQTSAL